MIKNPFVAEHARGNANVKPDPGNELVRPPRENCGESDTQASYSTQYYEAIHSLSPMFVYACAIRNCVCKVSAQCEDH